MLDKILKVKFLKKDENISPFWKSGGCKRDKY